MHSPWGILDQICESKGWTIEYVLEKVSWANVQMLAVDKVRFIKKSDIVIKVNKAELKEHRKRYQHG